MGLFCRYYTDFLVETTGWTFWQVMIPLYFLEILIFCKMWGSNLLHLYCVLPYIFCDIYWTKEMLRLLTNIVQLLYYALSQPVNRNTKAIIPIITMIKSKQMRICYGNHYIGFTIDIGVAFLTFAFMSYWHFEMVFFYREKNFSTFFFLSPVQGFLCRAQPSCKIKFFYLPHFLATTKRREKEPSFIAG